MTPPGIRVVYDNEEMWAWEYECDSCGKAGDWMCPTPNPSRFGCPLCRSFQVVLRGAAVPEVTQLGVFRNSGP